MKKLFYFLLLLYPMTICAQQNLIISSLSDCSWRNVGNAGFSAGVTASTSLAFSPSDGQPYVAYQDHANSDKTTVMKFDGTNWVTVGNAGFSAGSSLFTSLAFNSSGQPYVAFEAPTATVMKFDGSSWVNVGNANFSPCGANYMSLALSPSGEPYIAFQDGHYSMKASVMTFDGTNWIYVGNGGFSAGFAYNTSLAFSPVDGQPYVAYVDYSDNDSEKATVMKFNGTSWVNVGNPRFSQGVTDCTSLAFNPSDSLPYVAFKDCENSYKATVMKFDGNNWVYVGTDGFSAGRADYTNLAFNSSGQPYVAYSDWAIKYGNATVMKFDGTNWVNVGITCFSAGQADWISIAFSPSDGQPYVAYVDWGNAQKATVMKYDFPTGITELQKSRLSLYPNPSTNKITIESSEIPVNSQLSIINLNGQQLYTRQITDPKTQIDVSNLPSGVYFVRLTNDKSVAVGKFIKD